MSFESLHNFKIQPSGPFCANCKHSEHDFYRNAYTCWHPERKVYGDVEGFSSCDAFEDYSGEV